MGANTFAENLKHLLSRNDIPIEDLAFKAVVPLKYLIRYPTGQAEPNIRALLNLSEFFEVPIDMMLKTDMAAAEAEAAQMDIKFLAIDVDGVMTNGEVSLNENGDEIRAFHMHDTRAIVATVKKGVSVGFLSSNDKDGSVQAWAKKLGVGYVYCGKDHKSEVLRQWTEKLGIELSQVAFIGDDVNDIATVRRVGLGVAPSNANWRVKLECKVLLEKAGGAGAVREFVERFVTKVE